MVCAVVTTLYSPRDSEETHDISVLCFTVTANCSVITEAQVVIEQIVRVAKFTEHSVIVFPSEQQTNHGAAGVRTADGSVKPVISALATSAR